MAIKYFIILLTAERVEKQKISYHRKAELSRTRCFHACQRFQTSALYVYQKLTASASPLTLKNEARLVPVVCLPVCQSACLDVCLFIELLMVPGYRIFLFIAQRSWFRSMIKISSPSKWWNLEGKRDNQRKFAENGWNSVLTIMLTVHASTLLIMKTPPQNLFLSKYYGT